LPIAFVGFLVSIKKSVDGRDNFAPEIAPAYFPGDEASFTIFSFTDYVKHRSPSGATTDYEITGIPMKGFSWEAPFVKCDSRLCKEDGQDAVSFCEHLSLGLAPSSSSDLVEMKQAQKFQDHIYKRYPVLRNKEDLQFDFDFVRIFKSDEVIEDYVSASEYKYAENSKIAVAVVFDGTDQSINYNYKLRVNSTGFNAPEDSSRPGFPTTLPTDKNFEHYAKNDNNTCPLLPGTAEFGPYRSSCTGQYYAYDGALTVQRLIHAFIMNATGSKEKGRYVAEHGAQYASFPSVEYEEDGFYEAITGT
jgi:hypothetical protein